MAGIGVIWSTSSYKKSIHSILPFTYGIKSMSFLLCLHTKYKIDSLIEKLNYSFSFSSQQLENHIFLN